MTPKQLANYLGQEVKVFTEMEDGLTDAKYSGTLTQVSLDGFVHVGANGGWISKRIREVRLLLTPLSKITNEDKEEYEKILYGDKSENDAEHIFATAIDFLRSLGYAVGLKDGEWIDKTKL